VLDENRRIQRTLVLAKFIVDATRPNSRNRLITKTLGKIGVVSADYTGRAPNDEEFWLCTVVKEVTKTQSNPSSGLFILKPVRYVDRTQVNYLTTGFYTYEDEGGIRYVIPKYKNMYWLLSIEERRRLLDPSHIHSVVTVNYDIENAPVQQPATVPYRFQGDGIGNDIPESVIDNDLGIAEE
jgi:hypothetical protein